MPLVKFRFEVAGEVQFSRALETIGTAPKDLSEPFEFMANEFYDTMSSVFAAEGAFEERTRWQDLSPAYGKWKTRYFPGRKILERSGRMRRSLTVRGDSDSILNIGREELQIGTKVPYAMKHQTGTRWLPMRKIVELTQAQKLRWVHILHSWLYKQCQTATSDIRGKQ